MRRHMLKSVSALTLSALVLMAGSWAHAEEQAAGKLMSGFHPFALGATSGGPQTSMILGGVIVDPGLILMAGLGLKYDGNAAKGADKVGFDFVLHLEYMLVNMARFAMGPEVTYHGFVSQAGSNADAFSTNVVVPGWAFWFAPFPVPLALGTAWNLPITFQKGADPVLQTSTWQLRLCFIFG